MEKVIYEMSQLLIKTIGDNSSDMREIFLKPENEEIIEDSIAFVTDELYKIIDDYIKDIEVTELEI